jgi:hypothetical protein
MSLSRPRDALFTQAHFLPLGDRQQQGVARDLAWNRSPLPLFLPQPCLSRPQNRLSPVSDLELAENVGDMVAHRFQ